MVKPDGNIRDHYRFDAYGVSRNGSKVSEDGRNVNHNTFGYTGEMWDEEANLLYLRARYYEPETGRFLSRDTYRGELNNPLSRNLYAYVGNNPVNRIDPSGNQWLPYRIDENSATFYNDLGALLITHPYIAEQYFSDKETYYLQSFLNNFGFRDYEGKKLVLDGDYGKRTKSAHLKLWSAFNAHYEDNGTGCPTSIKSNAKDPYQDEAIPISLMDDPFFIAISMFTGSGEGRLIGQGGKVVIEESAELGIKKLSQSALKAIGTPGENSGIRVVKGTADDAIKFFKNQIKPSTLEEIEPGVFRGQDADGLWFTYRAVSKSGPPTIDINGIKGLRKIKFVSE